MGIVVEAGLGDIVVDPNGEVTFGLRLLQVVVDSLDHRRGEFLGRQSITSSDHHGSGFELAVSAFQTFMQRANHIEVERFADSAGFFRAIENSNLTNGRGERFEERLHAERAIQANFQQTDFFAAGVEVIDGLMRDFRARAHHEEHPLGIGRADIVKQVILASDDLGKLVHHRLHFRRRRVVVLVRAFADLEEDVRILCRSAQHRMIRRERALPVLDHTVHVDHGPHVVFIQHLDLVYFVRRAEAIKEMEKGDARLK